MSYRNSLYRQELELYRRRLEDTMRRITDAETPDELRGACTFLAHSLHDLFKIVERYVN